MTFFDDFVGTKHQYALRVCSKKATNPCVRINRRHSLEAYACYIMKKFFRKSQKRTKKTSNSSFIQHNLTTYYYTSTQWRSQPKIFGAQNVWL